MADWSGYQEAIFNEVQTGTSSIVIQAVAGSGKSTTLVEVFNRLPNSMKALFLAFNKDIVTALDKKLAGRAQCKTFHSLCMGALMRALNVKNVKTWVNSRKTWDLINEYEILLRHEHGEAVAEAMIRVLGGPAKRLLGLAKQVGIGIDGLIADVPEAWERIWDHHALDFDYRIVKQYGKVYQPSVEDLIRMCRWLLDRSVKTAERSIDFDDMIYMVLRLAVRLPQYDVIGVDEAQDTNPVRRTVVSQCLAPGGRVIAVGDRHQCQPAGTMVSLQGGDVKPIENVEVGDKLITYSTTSAHFRGRYSQGRRVERVCRRPYNGTMITISAGDREHECTPNHRCVVRLSEATRSKWAVYLMRRGCNWRIGSCLMMYKSGAGPTTRLRHEEADDVWILDLFDDREDAHELEVRVAYTCGIPQVIFKEVNAAKAWSQDRIDRFWSTLGDNTEKALRVLSEFGRMEEYPFATRGEDDRRGRYSFVTQAINLIDDAFEVAVDTGNKGAEWRKVKTKRRLFSGFVYSLQVEPTERGRRVYLANDIATHNSIYGFTGADAAAMDLIKEEFKAVELPLSVTYRCPRAVVEKAQEITPQIEAAPGAIEGSVTEMEPEKDEDLSEIFRGGDAVLCRNTLPLVKLAYTLIRNRIGCRIAGRDIGQGLVTLIDKLNRSTIERLRERAEEFQAKEIKRLTAKGDDAAAGAVEDKVGSLIVLINMMPEGSSVQDLRDQIDAMFSDRSEAGQVVLSTVHKAKGLEWNRVLILKPELFPSKWAKQEWQVKQEDNLLYVAYTRALRDLILLTWNDDEEKDHA